MATQPPEASSSASASDHSAPDPCCAGGDEIEHRISTIEARWLVGLVLVGLSFRIIVVMLRSADLSTDPDAYIGHATTLLQNGCYCVPGTSNPTAYRSPFYPALLALLIGSGLKPSAAAGLVNVVSAALLTIATWWLARFLGLRKSALYIATAITALDPLLLRYAALPMTETLSAMLLTIGVLQLLKGASRIRLGEPTRRIIRAFALSGLCFGLNGLCRPVALITCALMCLCGAFLILLRQAPVGTTISTGKRFLSSSFCLIPGVVCGIILLPWIVRNQMVFHAFIPATTHGGYTLLLGNNEVFYREVVMAPGQPVWSGTSLQRWQQDMQQQAEQAVAGNRSEVSIDRWMYDTAVQTIAENGAAFRRACLLRWKRFWATTPEAEAAETGVFLRRILSLWYGGLWCGLVASLFCMIRRPGDIQLLWIAILSFLLLHTFYWTNARMRAPLTGIICVLGVIGWQQVYCLFRQPSRRSCPPSAKD